MKLIEQIEKIGREEYEIKYGELRTWACTLSDGTVYKLKEDGGERLVSYDERLQYCDMVKNARMSEGDKQVHFRDEFRIATISVDIKVVACRLMLYVEAYNQSYPSIYAVC